MNRHVPVLLSEVVERLNLKKGLHVVDCTLGDGGHSEAILEKIGYSGKLLGIDADTESLLRAKQNLYRFAEQTKFVHANFARLQEIITEQQFTPVDRILMDLGWSTPQFAERGRGFSFEGSEPLDMRYGSKVSADDETAAAIVNKSSEQALITIFKKYGEEDLSKEIAAAIVEHRKQQPIAMTNELVEIILQVYRTKLKSTKEIPWIGGLHPATKVFQALRIAVNHELEVLEQALPQAVEVLATGGRLAVISFHSLEDRIVKHFFQSLPAKEFKIITKKPVVATPEELKKNPPSRSAKLRVIEKI
jgi:16S rRNA (cytosine1402-N4)-methyltransferase